MDGLLKRFIPSDAHIPAPSMVLRSAFRFGVVLGTMWHSRDSGDSFMPRSAVPTQVELQGIQNAGGETQT